MGFISGINIQGNLPKTYSLASWLRQQSAPSVRDGGVRGLDCFSIASGEPGTWILELLKVGKEKRALKLLKARLGTHKRAKLKREDMANELRKQRMK